MHNYYYNYAIELFIKKATMSGDVDVDYELFTEDAKEMLTRNKPFIREALCLSISDGCEVHVFEKYDGSMAIMYDDAGTYHMKFEDPRCSGMYDVGTKFVCVNTNTPSPSSEAHKSGGRFLDSLVYSMLDRALSSYLSDDLLFWNFIKLFRLVREWRDAFINLHEEMLKIANEDHNAVCVRFTFDGQVLKTYYDEIHEIGTPYDFSFNINDCRFIAHTPHTDSEGIIVDFDAGGCLECTHNARLKFRGKSLNAYDLEDEDDEEE